MFVCDLYGTPGKELTISGGYLELSSSVFADGTCLDVRETMATVGGGGFPPFSLLGLHRAPKRLCTSMHVRL